MIKSEKGLSYFGGHFVCKGKRYVPILFQGRPKEGLFPLLIVVGHTSGILAIFLSQFS